MNRKVRTALYACALMAPLILQSCNAQSEKKESNKECTEETNKNTEKMLISWKRNRQAIYSIHCRSRLLCPPLGI